MGTELRFDVIEIERAQAGIIDQWAAENLGRRFSGLLSA